MSDHIVLRSPYPDVEIPASTIPAKFCAMRPPWVPKRPSSTPLTGECVSYAQLGYSVHGVAAGLPRQRGAALAPWSG